MPGLNSKHVFRLARARRWVGTVRWSSSARPEWSVRSPKELYDHLSQYIVGQERAKRILSVAVFNHYHRIAPRLYPGPSAPSPSRSVNSPPSLLNDFPLSQPSSSSAYTSRSDTFGRGDSKLSDSAQGSSELDDIIDRDSTRVIGTGEEGADPTLTHDMLTSRSREGRWARDGFFSSRTPPAPTPSLLGKPRRRKSSDREPADASATETGEKRSEARRRRQAEEEIRLQKDELEAGLTGEKKSGEDVVIEKSNVLMIAHLRSGPTGTGKTLMARTLAKILDVPFASCDATTYTQAGYVGEDVENCVLRLLQAAEYDVSRTEIGIVHIDEIDKLARRGGNEFGTWGGGRDVGGEGVQQALLRLLEGTTLTLTAKPPAISSVPPSSSSPLGSPSTSGAGGSSERSGPRAESSAAFGEPPGWDPNNPMNRSFAAGKKGVREGLPGFGGGSGSSGKGETFVIDTTNILFVLSGAFVGLESIVNQRIGKGSIGFNAALPLPPVTNSTSATVSPLPLKGLATPDLQTYGLIPEFLGRLPVLSTLHPLSIEDLVRILVEPRNALIKQYQAMFGRYGSELGFTREAIEEIAREGLDRGGGARGLRGVLEEVLVDAMFEVPGSSVRYCLVTKDVVRRLEPAHYFSRGQRMAFLNALQDETGSKAGGAQEQAPPPVENEEEVEEKMSATG
ncbi:hypothetical protein EHS25_002171 [Saitozyma podzolica]|uniref:ATP-dependent Clp protease ATP-binding subunit ClpX n=1 Tax=Saitozyma podzolica TaxID=1890683 RepID=A0A427YEX7_9TREE|nr:hypothetical protein EHS25_002171 [Saitozyma podzolica]